MSATFDPANLRPGDVLLMKGIGSLSDLIAYFGDSIYSHGAIVVEGANLIEAAVPHSRIQTIASRLAQGNHYDFVDAFRPTDPGFMPLLQNDRDAINVAAQELLNVPYPVSQLFQLGLFAAIRNKVPQNAHIRWLIHAVIDHLVENNPAHMVCTELVYRALLDAKPAPKRDLSPKVIITAQLDMPFPTVNWIELYEEYRRAKQTQPQLGGSTGAALEQALQANAAVAASNAPTVLSATVDDPAAPSADALQSAYARLREMHLPTEVVDAVSAVPVVPKPNPKLVMPADLETSPQIRFLGRLPLTKA